MSITTKNIPSGNKISKTLEPGNASCKINSISLKPFTFKDGGYELILNMEGKDMGASFEGFYIDNTDHSRGRHAGQVGKVKSGQWAFADSVTKGGVSIKRDDEILKFMNNLCNALGPKAIKWLDEQDNKHDNIESLIEKFNNDRPFDSVFLSYCFAGKEYMNKEGYINHELFLPKFTKVAAPFSADPTKVIVFNTADHIIKKKTQNVSTFTDGATEAGENIKSNDFEL